MKRLLALLPCLALLSAGIVVGTWLLAGPGGRIGEACYTVLCPLGVDIWFPAETAVELSADAPEADLARLGAVCARLVDTDWSCRVEQDADGRTARVKLRTWHPAESRALAESIRREYLRETAGQEPSAHNPQP